MIETLLKTSRIFLYLYALILSFPLNVFCDDWEFVAAPYIQLPWISGNASIGPIEDADVDVSPSDILDYFSLGGMVQLEAQHSSGVGFILNYGFMKLENSFEGPKGFVDFDGDLFQGVLEGFTSYTWQLGTTDVALYTGARWWDIDMDITASTELEDLDRSRDVDWVDPVVGFRVVPTIADSLRLYAQADLGGFDVSSNSSYRVSGGVLWSLTQFTSLALLYQAMWVDYGEGDPMESDRFAYDTVTHGPIVGAVFKF